MAISNYYFAWVGSGETSFNGSHMREDELIFSFEMKHDEGQFAELVLEILNPYIGLLAPGRPLWAWFSWHDGSNIYPVFFGRLVGIPDDLFQDIIKIKLIARPQNYAEQRQVVAEGLKVLPYYDPIFIDESKLDDDDTALEGYSRLWHVDRFASTVSSSDIITGEDGYVEFTQTEAFYDKLSMKISGAPLLVCEIEAEVEWTQCDHTGKFEMKTVPNTSDAENVGSTITGYNFAGGGFTSSGGSSGLGSFADQGAPKDQTQTTYTWTYKNVSGGPHSDGDTMEESGSTSVPYYWGDLVKRDKYEQKADKETGQGEEYSIKESHKYSYEYQPPKASNPITVGGGGGDSGGSTAKEIKNAVKEIAVEVQQDRAEGIYVALAADVQPVLASLTENQDDLVESLRMDARDLVAAGVLSIHSGAYFATDRGQQSVEYLLMVARAHLLAGSRVVEIEWECPLPKIVYSAMSCRKNAVIYDNRLPGGVAVGKVVSYEMTGDGDKGEFLGAVKINCSVGTGTSPVMRSGRAGIESRDVTLVEGTPVYVNVGYVDYGYQHYAGRMIPAATNDVSFSPLEFQLSGLQLPITEDQVLVRHEYHDGAASGEVAATIQSVTQQLRDFQVGPIGQPIDAPPQAALDYALLEQNANQVIAQVIYDNPSWVEMEFKPTLGISARADYNVNVGTLSLPKQIDLSAPASS